MFLAGCGAWGLGFLQNFSWPGECWPAAIARNERPASGDLRRMEYRERQIYDIERDQYKIYRASGERNPT